MKHVDWHHINHLHATMQRCVSVALRVLLWQGALAFGGIVEVAFLCAVDGRITACWGRGE